MNHYFILFIAAFALTGCHRGNTESETSENETIRLAIDLDRKSDKASFYDIFESVSLIQLETTDEALLNHIDKIIFQHDSIFIMDKKQGTIFLFDAKGRFLNKLAKLGAGPDEYVNLSDFAVNNYNNSLELLAAYDGITCYDLNFNFLKKIPLADKKKLVHRFAIADSCTRVLFSMFGTHNLAIYDINKQKITQEFLEIPPFIYRKCPIDGPFLLENKQEGEAIFTQPFSNITYSVTSSTLRERYQWDFGKYNFSVQELKPDLSQEEYERIFASHSFADNNVYAFLANAENANLYLCQFAFGKERKVYTVLYNKATDKYIRIDKLEEGLSFPYYPVVAENYLYVIPRDTFVLNALLNEQIKRENSISLKAWNEENNPMILKYKLKKSDKSPQILSEEISR